MKKFFYFTTLVLLAFFTLSSCTKNSSNYPKEIVGMWVLMDQNGTEVLTDDIFVICFDGNGTELFACIQDISEDNRIWVEEEFQYSISGDAIHITGEDLFGEGGEYTLKIQDIDDSYMTYTEGGDKYKMRKIKYTYSESILGLWEGKNVTPGVDPDSKLGELHRWRYLEDGTYQYYYKNEAGEWELKEDNIGKYFVYGDLLACNWGTTDYNTGVEGTFSEAWIIEILQYENDGTMVMNWEGRRSNDSKVYYSMTKITE